MPHSNQITWAEMATVIYARGEFPNVAEEPGPYPDRFEHTLRICQCVWGEVNRTRDGRWGRLEPHNTYLEYAVMQWVSDVAESILLSAPPELDTTLMPHSPTLKADWRIIRLKSPSNDVGHAMRANPQHHACTKPP